MKKKEGINIIFLDFDGVINTKEDDYTGKEVNNDAIYYINKLCLETGFKIVVCSSWRHRMNYKDFLYNAGIRPEIEIIGKTEYNPYGREAEIKDYLKENKVDKYIIIDDSYLSSDMKDHHVQPASRLGFTQNKYEEAMKKISQL